MVPELGFSALELMQARVAEVPTGWDFVHLKKAYKIRNSMRKPINQTERAKNPGSYPYYGPTKAQGHIGSYEQDGEFALIGEDGDHFLKYRSAPMTQLIDGKCTVNNHAHIIEGGRRATREWFYHYFMHRDIFAFLTRQGAGRYKLNKAALEKLPILLPPVAEQTQIANILSIWNQAIETAEKLIENSNAQKRALMQQLLTGKMRMPGFRGEWQRPKASDIFEPVSNRNNANEELLSVTQDQGVVPRSQLNRKVVMPEGTTANYKLVVPGNFVISLRSFQGGLEYSEHRGLVSPAYTVLKPVKPISDSFYRHFFKSYEFIGRLAVTVIGIRDGKQVSYGDFSFLRLPYPSTKEQAAISMTLDTSEAEHGCLLDQLERLKEEKKALMQQLLTGKRRVKVTA